MRYQDHRHESQGLSEHSLLKCLNRDPDNKLDEMFTILTLIQTKKMDYAPVVL